jgi:hypothetical protein
MKGMNYEYGCLLGNFIQPSVLSLGYSPSYCDRLSILVLPSNLNTKINPHTKQQVNYGFNL